jgi:uncharacterized protein (DUF952 family)
VARALVRNAERAQAGDVTSRIFHLATESELALGLYGGRYTPRRYAEDGFVHCTATMRRALEVAHDYFASVTEPVVVLEIEPEALTSRLVFEAPRTIEGGGTTHLHDGELFPHVYGPLNLGAVTGAARLVREGDRFQWPARFLPLRDYLTAHDTPP